MSKSENPRKRANLEEFDGIELQQLMRDQKRMLANMENERNELRAERKDQVEIVKSLRSALGKVQIADAGRKSLLKGFHRLRNAAEKEKNLRDSINKCIPPPSNILVEWLTETHIRLTTIDNDLTAVPMLNPELDAFRRFFEIQASVQRKGLAESAHSNYSSHIREMSSIAKKLDEYKEDTGKRISEVKENLSIDEGGINRKEVRRISNRISTIDKRLDELTTEKKSTRKELVRMGKFSRILTGRTGPVKISDIKDIAISGGNLSTDEMEALLDSGGLSSLKEAVPENKSGPGTSRKPKKRSRKLGISRGGSRKGSLARRRDE